MLGYEGGIMDKMKQFYVLLYLNYWCWCVVSFDCDFEMPCDWKWTEDIGGFRIAISNNSSVEIVGDADNNPNGHFLYFSMTNGSRPIASIHSPLLPNGSLSKCELEFWVHMSNMENGNVKTFAKMTNYSVEIKTIPGTNENKWVKYLQKIGPRSRPFSFLIEAVMNLGGHVAIDNIRLLHCLSKRIEVKECTAHYFLCYQSDCIYRNQVCDIFRDCPDGEDEQQKCDEIPKSAYCDFEMDTCGWTGNTTQELQGYGKWIRRRLHTPEGRNIEIYDHTFGNSSGHFMSPLFNRKVFGHRIYLNSATFRPPPIYHRYIHSAYYNTCQVRFYFYMTKNALASLDLNCVVLDTSYASGKTIPLWHASSIDNHWKRVVLPIPAIKHSFFLQFIATHSLDKNNIRIDDISLSPECFGIGVPGNESEIPKSGEKNGTSRSINNDSFNEFYHFTTCGQTGNRGPNPMMCSDSYRNTSTIVDVIEEKNRLAGVQKWTVPYMGKYTVVTRGAGGGRGVRNNATSRGAVVRGTFSWNQGEVIYILVGQKGIGPKDVEPCTKKGDSCSYSKIGMKDVKEVGGGGGGATYVFKMNANRTFATALLISGGGGGSSSDRWEKGVVEPNGRGYNASILAGNGASSENGAGGGGGWTDKAYYYSSTSGLSLIEGGTGGQPCHKFSTSKAQGGFGGGGGPCLSGGGGGGYRGGDAPSSDNPYTNGQGGTSYVKDDTQYPFVQPGINEGDGSVDIIPAQTGCGCQYLCLMLDIRNNAFHCICPGEEQLDSDGLYCTDSKENQFNLTPHQIVLIVLCTTISVVLIAIFVYLGVNRYKKKKSRDLSHEPLNNTEVQLNRLRQVGGGMVTEYNPNYEFGGSTCTIQDLNHIARENLTLVKALGQGAFGEVYQGYLAGQSDGSEMPIAVKTLPELSSSQSEMDFLMEALIMSKFNHPNIVKFIGVCFEKMPRFIVLELLPGGDLKSFLRESRPKPHKPSELTMLDLLSLSLDIAKGCQYLEENHFIHRDIAARNCLLTTKGPGRIVKIADFGMARDIYRADYYRKGGKAMLPVKWMPPEAFLDGIFTTKTDVWSFGVLLWEVMSLGYMPYPGWGNQEVMQLVTSGGRLEPPNNCPNQIYHIMMRCWHPIPDERPNFITIIERLGYCLQDPDVIKSPLPVFHRPPSLEKDTTVMRPPDSENSCLQIQRQEIVSPGSEDYLIPMPSSNYSLATDNTEIQSSPSVGSVDQLLELEETNQTHETNLSHPPFDKKGYRAVPVKCSRRLSSSDSLEALPIAPSVEKQSNLPLNAKALQHQSANRPMRYINVEVNQSTPGYDGVDGINPVA